MKNKYIIIISLIFGSIIASNFNYYDLLLFLKNHARIIFVLLFGFSIGSNFIKTNSVKFKDSIFNFLLILWASFWFLCFEASYIPLYTEGQCLKGEYFNHKLFSMELETIKYNQPFGFMKYDMNKFLHLQKKYKTLENFYIVKKSNDGYYMSNQNGIEIFIPVYEDINYVANNCPNKI